MRAGGDDRSATERKARARRRKRRIAANRVVVAGDIALAMHALYRQPLPQPVGDLAGLLCQLETLRTAFPEDGQ